MMTNNVAFSYLLFMISAMIAGFGIDAHNVGVLFVSAMGMLAVLMLRLES